MSTFNFVRPCRPCRNTVLSLIILSCFVIVASAQSSRLYRWPFAENGRAIATEDRAGHVKIRATPGGRVVGAGIVGPNADDLIVPWTLAITRAIPLNVVAALPVAALSTSDVSRRAAVIFVAGRLRSPWIKRLVSLLQKLG